MAIERALTVYGKAMNRSTEESLTRFIQVAGRARKFSYYPDAKRQGGFKVEVQLGGEVPQTSDNLPAEEPTAAIAQVLRMLTQDNDPASIGNLAKLVTTSEVSERWKARFLDARSELDGYLDSDAGLKVDGKEYTEWDLFDTMLYGGIAHNNVKKSALVKEWMGMPV